MVSGGLKTALVGLEDSSLDGMLAPRWARRGQVEPKIAKVSPKRGSGRGRRALDSVFIVVPRPFLGSYWAHLGLSWALLGPSWGVQEGILRQILGLEGLPRGCKGHVEPKMAKDGPKRAPGIILPDFAVVCRPFLGPS